VPKYKQRLYKNHFCCIACADEYKTTIPAKDHPRFISRDDIEDFSSEQKELIIGTVLGDASILQNSRGNAHLSIAHSVKQLDYLQYKQELLKPFSRPIGEYGRYDKRYGRTYWTHRFFTRCHPFLTELRQVFYGNNGKELPAKIIENLTARSFSFWYFDDGNNMTGYATTICTVSFPVDQVRTACEILGDKWGISCHPTKDGRIYIRAGSYDRMEQLIQPFMIPSMEYKLGFKRR